MFRPVHFRSLVCTGAMLALAGCGSDPVAPLDASAARAAAGGPTTQLSIHEFVAAQGSYCGGDGGFCDPIEGIGSILVWGDETGTPAASIDFGGVNARWYEANVGVDVGYTYDGTVRERRLADGRRLVTVTLRYENTLLAAAASFDAPTPLVGAFFEEYRTADVATASGTVTIQMVLPADYVGLPDMIQVIFDPLPGMELLQLVVNQRGEGTLRQDYEGTTAGTTVRVTAHVDYLPKLIGTPAEHSTGLRRTFFGPGDAARIQPLGR